MNKIKQITIDDINGKRYIYNDVYISKSDTALFIKVNDNETVTYILRNLIKYRYEI